MTARSPSSRALLLASVALVTVDLSARAAPAWPAGRQYALDVPRSVADDAAALAAEPVTREYERYAKYLPANSADDLGDVSSSGRADPGPPPFMDVPAAQPETGPAPASVQTAQAASGRAGTPNPFRAPAAGPLPDEPRTGATTSSASPSGRAVPVAPVDPLTVDIDRSIRQISADAAPQVAGTVSLRGRSGAEGLSQLFALEAPVEASFSPAGYGRLKVQVTPTYLFSGRVNATNSRIYGTNALAPAGSATTVGNANNVAGAGLGVGYTYGSVSADIGTTPLGFQETSIVGGIEYAPRLSNALTLRVLGERRAVTDSLLSFGGLRDPRTGESWGGVTRNRGHVQLEGVAGAVSYYAGAGGSVLTGEQVKSNTEAEAGAGFSLPVYTTPTQQVRVGLDLVYFGYRRNLGNFTVGNGGYFSPQQFFAAIIPVTYREQVTPDLVYTVGGSLGGQNFRAKSQRTFPSDPALQAQLDALAAANPGVNTQLAGFSGTGITGGARAEVDYRVNDNLHIGAKAGFDRSGNFTEGTGLVYARYVFNDPP